MKGCGNSRRGTTDIRCALSFDYIDRDGDGLLTIKELRQYSRTHNNFLTEQELTAIFELTDDDSSHTITPAEYTEQVGESENMVHAMLLCNNTATTNTLAMG